MAEAFGGHFHDEWSQSSNLTLGEKRKFKRKEKSGVGGGGIMKSRAAPSREFISRSQREHFLCGIHRVLTRNALNSPLPASTIEMPSYQILQICVKLTGEVDFVFMALYFIVFRHFTEPKCVRVCVSECWGAGREGGGGLRVVHW